MGVVHGVDAEDRIVAYVREAIREKRRLNQWGRFTIEIEFKDGSPKMAEITTSTTVKFAD